MKLSLIVRSAGAVALAALVSVPASTPLVAQGDANQLIPASAYKDLKWRSVGATRGGVLAVRLLRCRERPPGYRDVDAAMHGNP